MIKMLGLDKALKDMDKLEKKFTKQLKKPMRIALNAGAKSLKETVKPLVPVMSVSTNFRQKGTVKNNIRSKTRIAKNAKSGYTVVGVMRPKGQRMARIGENTRDKRDPFYWWMVEFGTKKMTGRHYMEKGGNKGIEKATKVVEERFIQELKKL
ncbi:HK97 gp10 family phage protein [Pasteurella multocida]|uniref:HK97-gp10 family putative phage morphogenesis protein n=1 Tax=Pasteurella multocida TaxID=747 RepID=UPI000E00AA5A|nr:HK97-gp10 family putative phage morphogenesis protein [Pasteurella multocida]MCL7816664.1 HK97 gp10 family phage protein [Pasteurella multocida]MDY0640636.1 HK97 gp10 family phage protein [Pasteurella multocida]SUB43302.1 phage protein, HK97 gp10 family [Pasteurella multocida subsp. septica]HDR1026854.1 HK97 gp10 family phage protein [Pasteurella multocida]